MCVGQPIVVVFGPADVLEQDQETIFLFRSNAVQPISSPLFSIMKSNGLLGEKLPFYQKVLNMTLGITGSDRSPSTRKAEEPLASPFRRGYTRPGRPGLPVTPIVVTTPGHPAHISTPVGSVAGTGSATKHGSASSTAASIFRSFRRRSLRRSFRRTKSFLVKNSPTVTSSSTTVPAVTGNVIKRQTSTSKHD